MVGNETKYVPEGNMVSVDLALGNVCILCSACTCLLAQGIRLNAFRVFLDINIFNDWCGTSLVGVQK